MPRFSANEYPKHKNCSDTGPMDFPPVHYRAPTCLACNVEVFLENGEFARWIFIIFMIVEEPDADMRRTDEFLFWHDWFEALMDGAFYEPPVEELRLGNEV